MVGGAPTICKGVRKKDQRAREKRFHEAHEEFLQTNDPYKKSAASSRGGIGPIDMPTVDSKPEEIEQYINARMAAGEDPIALLGMKIQSASASSGDIKERRPSRSRHQRQTQGPRPSRRRPSRSRQPRHHKRSD